MWYGVENGLQIWEEADSKLCLILSHLSCVSLGESFLISLGPIKWEFIQFSSTNHWVSSIGWEYGVELGDKSTLFSWSFHLMRGHMIVQEEKGTTEYEMARWHHQLNGHKFEQQYIPRVGDGRGSLVCCCPWGHKESDTTQRLNWW